jgi:phage baseplate assembly protein V
MSDISALIRDSLAPVRRRVRLMISRAILNAVNDAGGIQLVQVKLLEGETRDVERMQNYGHTSVPLPGAEGLGVSVGGSRNHVVVLVMDDGRHRMKGLKPGEVAMYSHLDNEAHRHHIHLDENGDLHVMAKNIYCKAEEKARIEGDIVELHARSKFRFDANGQGQQWDGEGVETWQDNDIPKPHHIHHPPEIP